MGIEKAKKMIGGLNCLSWEDRLRAGLAQPAEEGSLGRPHCGFPVLKWCLLEKWGDTLYQGLVVTGQGIMALNLEKVNLD